MPASSKDSRPEDAGVTRFSKRQSGLAHHIVRALNADGICVWFKQSSKDGSRLQAVHSHNFRRPDSWDAAHWSQSLKSAAARCLKRGQAVRVDCPPADGQEPEARRSLLIVPFGGESERSGAAAFVGNGVMADAYGRHGDVLADCLSLLAGADREPPGPEKADLLAVALLRARSPAEAARVAADFLCQALKARRSSVLEQQRGKWRLLAASGANRVDRNSPEVREIESEFTRLGNGEILADRAGGPLGTWYDDPAAAGLGILVDRPSVAGDDIFRAAAPLVVHAIHARQPGWKKALGLTGQVADGSPGRHFTRRALWAAALLLVLGLLIRPVEMTLTGTCELIPADRAMAVFEATGKIAGVFISEGDAVTVGQPLARLDTAELEAEREVARQEFRKRESEARRSFTGEKMTEYRIAHLEMRKAQEHLRRTEVDLAHGTLASPAAGIVLTKDLRRRSGEMVPEGEVFCEIASLDRWDLQIAMDEADAGAIEEVLRKQGKVLVRFVLSSRADLTLQTEITSEDQVSQMIYEAAGRKVVYLTVKDVALPAEIEREMRPGFSGIAKAAGPIRPWVLGALSRAMQWVQMHFLW